MKSIWLENFRCFRSKQTVPLASLTLLVGENSTGKSSFMALIHAMVGIMAGDHPSKSWKDTYSFGRFEQIVYTQKNKSEVNVIEAGFAFEHSLGNELLCDLTFRPFQDSSFSVDGKLTYKDLWISTRWKPEYDSSVLSFGRKDGEWEFLVGGTSVHIWSLQVLQTLKTVLANMPRFVDLVESHSSPMTQEDIDSFLQFIDLFDTNTLGRSFAGAPIRSKPLRTYDPISSSPDSEGANIPLYFAELSRGDKVAWEAMRKNLQSFGQSAGLLDEINVRDFGDTANDPFQVHVKEFTKEGEGHLRNLVDVGYGVSQILPVVAELHRRSKTTMFLLQQPEVHLHPSAQAALGSLFCDFADQERQLIVETHSDHLVDRVRMEVRDGKTNLTKDDVLLLFFERDGSDVKIHPIRFDEDGNVVGAPENYRQFFLEETTRSIGW